MLLAGECMEESGSQRRESVYKRAHGAKVWSTGEACGIMHGCTDHPYLPPLDPSFQDPHQAPSMLLA
jgi:hypothetical protein